MKTNLVKLACDLCRASAFVEIEAGGMEPFKVPARWVELSRGPNCVENDVCPQCSKDISVIVRQQEAES